LIGGPSRCRIRVRKGGLTMCFGQEIERSPVTGDDKVTLLIASFIQEEYVRQIQAVDARLDVIYRPDLLRCPRYASDHYGVPFDRTGEQEAEWRALLARADVMFDFDETHREDLPDLAPRVKWIQASASGIGQFVAEMRYAERMPDTVITNTRGVHAQPLAEFCIMVMLMFRKGLLRMVRQQARKHWERFAGTDLEGRTAVILGYGAIGREVARMCKAMRMQVIGVGRSSASQLPDRGPADEYWSVADLRTVLPRAEHLVLVLPHTPETIGLIGAKEMSLLPEGAILVNIGRGTTVDENALAAALSSGHLGGAGLDVFASEPLPSDSPLWDMPNVLVSPHSGSTTERENPRITDFFCENLRRYLAGEPLMNVVDPDRYY